MQGTGLSASAVLQKYVQPEAGTTSRISTRGESAILSSFTVSPSTPSSGEKAQCQDSLRFVARGIADWRVNAFTASRSGFEMGFRRHLSAVSLSSQKHSEESV